MAIPELTQVENLDEEISDLSEISELIFNLGTQLHQIFDQQIWQNQLQHSNSYHNDLHISNAVQAAEILLAAAIDQNKDPLGILQDLEAWNSNSQEEISLHELPTLFKIAFSLHDLGNIMDESLNFFQSGYQASEAEARSSAIAKKLLSGVIADRFVEFVQHLILETTYETNNDVLFAKTVKIIDQLGSSLLLSEEQREQAQLGLLEEMTQEQGKKPIINPFHFFNFIQHRSQKFASRGIIEELLSIWKKEMPRMKSESELQHYNELFEHQENAQ